MAKSTTPAPSIETDISPEARFTSEGLTQWPKLPDRAKLQRACPQQFKDLAAELLADYDASKAFLSEFPIEEWAGLLRGTFGLAAIDLNNKINAVDRQEYNDHQTRLRDSTQLLITLAAQIFKAVEGAIHDDLVAEVKLIEERCHRLNIPVSEVEYHNSENVTVYFAWRDPALARLHQARWALNYFAERASSHPRIYSDGQFVEAVRYSATEQASSDPM
jgi:hypothetical protein